MACRGDPVQTTRLVRRELRAIRFGHKLPQEEAAELAAKEAAKAAKRAAKAAAEQELLNKRSASYHSLLWGEVDWFNLWDLGGFGDRYDFSFVVLYYGLGCRPVIGKR